MKHSADEGRERQRELRPSETVYSGRAHERDGEGSREGAARMRTGFSGGDERERGGDRATGRRFEVERTTARGLWIGPSGESVENSDGVGLDWRPHLSPDPDTRPIRDPPPPAKSKQFSQGEKIAFSRGRGRGGKEGGGRLPPTCPLRPTCHARKPPRSASPKANVRLNPN